MYSFALILWSLWVRAEPWAGADMRALLARVMVGEEPRPPVPGATMRRAGGGCRTGTSNGSVRATYMVEGPLPGRQVAAGRGHAVF